MQGISSAMAFYRACMILALCVGCISSLPLPSPQGVGGILGGLLGTILGITTLLPGEITSLLGVQTAVATIDTYLESDTATTTEAISAYTALLNAIVPDPAPTSIPSLMTLAADTFANLTSTEPKTFLDNALELVVSGISVGSAESIISNAMSGNNSDQNDNTWVPATAIYPQKGSTDAPYSLNETTLRSAIFFPAEFEFGANGKQPVIMVPGTGAAAATTYSSNYFKLLAATDFADPVLLNIPSLSLNDLQVNAEFVAYAINYVSGISNNVNVSTITWSQGSVNVQWALKYWPSTRSVVNDFIAVSPDFKGTALFNLLCPGFPQLPCDAAILQQSLTSNFIATLNADSGNSAYVPTTTIYSAADDIVQPQSGINASGYILDERGVGVSNNEVQLLCPDQPAGGPYLHEG